MLQQIEDNDDSQQEIINKSEDISLDLLPDKSKKRYKEVYLNFTNWKKAKNITSTREPTLLVYFKELSRVRKMVPSTLWSVFSMLKKTLYLYENVDISNFEKLSSLLKKEKESYQPKKSKTFASAEISRYCNEASDFHYLAIKVILIVGFSGGLKREEIYNISTNDVKNYGNNLIFNIPKSKNADQKSFVVIGKLCDYVKKYQSLHTGKSKNFFIHYHKGKCTNQVIGLNKIGMIPRQVAEFLTLPEPELYNGHSFRWSAGTVPPDAEAGITDELERFSGLESSSIERLIPIPIKEEDTFCEFNKRMYKEDEMWMNFANLQNDNSMHLEQNMLTYSSGNNYQAAVGSDDYLQHFTEERRDLNQQSRTETGIEEFRVQKIEIEIESASQPSLLKEEIVNKDPELFEEFHAVSERIKLEDRQISEEFETTDTKPAILYENDQDPRSKESLKFSEAMFKETNYTTNLLVCRLCAYQRNDTVDMFGHNGTYRNIIEKIKHCLPIVVRETDTLPKQACHSCLEKLEFCHQFYKSVKKAEEQLTMLDRKISDDFWESDKHYQTSLLHNEQCGSKKHEIELNTSSAEDTNNNRSTSVSEKPQIVNPIAVSSASSSISILYSKELFTSNINALSLINQDRNTDSSSFERSSTSTCLVEENLPHLNGAPKLDEAKSTSKLYSPSITMNSKFSNNVETKRKDVANETFTNYSLVRKMIRCRICGKLFRTAIRCDLHSKVHASENYYPCSLCDKTFTTLKDWREHGLEHIQNEKFRRKLATFDCNECGKRFLTEGRLQFHKFNHSSDVKPSHCKKCDKIMDSEAALYQHVLTIHSQDKDHCCDICGKKFRSESQLNGHKGKHTEKRIEENFSCAHCEKSFEQKWSLVIHIRSHTGERPFSCDFCDKSYKTKAQRNSHRRTHTGEKPFKCSTCGKTFAQALRLSEHANVHARTRPYKCSLCDKSFKRIHARTVHMTTHTGEKLYQCNVCGKKFRWPSAMRRHKKYQHVIK